MEEAGESVGSEAEKERENEPSKRAVAHRECASKPKKRRVLSTDDHPQRKGHGRPHRDKGKGKHGYRPHTNSQGFKFRHGGSISDPLNLQGLDGVTSECSTCNPSPVDTPPVQSPPTAPASGYQSTDPLNLTTAIKSELKKKGRKDKHRLRSKKLKSHSRSVSEAEPPHDETAPADDDTAVADDVTRGSSGPTEPDAVAQTDAQKEGKSKQQKDAARFCYGNYNRYYGYRNKGVLEPDPRLDLITPELIKGKDVLDVGCNTGQVTIMAARELSPRSITGIDIDGHLITIAQKNILRAMPAPKLEGKTVKFPLSIVLMCGPLAQLPGAEEATSSDGDFPHNIHFHQVCDGCHCMSTVDTDGKRSISCIAYEYICWIAHILNTVLTIVIIFFTYLN